MIICQKPTVHTEVALRIVEHRNKRRWKNGQRSTSLQGVTQ